MLLQILILIMNIKVSLLGYHENLLNTKWNETQFATESRLKEEPNSVEEIHFTWNTLFYESKITYKF
jgi:hypothetical protein